MGKCQLSDSHVNGRLQNTVKQEEEYLNAYAVLRETQAELGACFRFYGTGVQWEEPDPNVRGQPRGRGH